MRSFRSALGLAITTAVLPVVAAYAADITPRPQAVAAPNEPPAAIPVESLSTGLRLNVDVASAVPVSGELRALPVGPAVSPLPRAEEVRFSPATSGATAFSRAEDALYGYPGSGAGGTGLKLAPTSGSLKPGWEVSGRVGPLRFLSPLDGERETKLRLGGRVPGQPRMPGLGLFNVGIHYNFE